MHLFFLIFLSIVLSHFSYGGDDCRDSVAQLLDQSENEIREIESNLKSSQSEDRLKGLQALRELKPDGDHIGLEILSFIQDSNPEVRLEAVRVFEQQDAVDAQTINALSSQLLREKDPHIYGVILHVLSAIHLQFVNEILHTGERITKYLYALNFSIEKASHLVEKLGYTPAQWLKITQRAVDMKSNKPAVIEELALEIYNEISSAENDLRIVINTLPFKSSLDFFKFIASYKKISGKKIELSEQTIFIIKMMYLPLNQ